MNLDCIFFYNIVNIVSTWLMFLKYTWKLHICNRRESHHVFIDDKYNIYTLRDEKCTLSIFLVIGVNIRGKWNDYMTSIHKKLQNIKDILWLIFKVVINVHKFVFSTNWYNVLPIYIVCVHIKANKTTWVHFNLERPLQNNFSDLLRRKLANTSKYCDICR